MTDTNTASKAPTHIAYHVRDREGICQVVARPEVSKDAHAAADKVRDSGGELMVTLGPGTDVDDFLALARGHGGRVVQVTPRYQTLEDVFVRRVQAARAGGVEVAS